jgi:hypothetical protein
MHELSLAGLVPAGQVQGLLMIMQGLCAMTPVSQYEWRLFFEGPDAPSRLCALETRRHPAAPYWSELDAYLSRQSYRLAAAYDLADSDFGHAVKMGQADSGHAVKMDGGDADGGDADGVDDEQ